MHISAEGVSRINNNQLFDELLGKPFDTDRFGRFAALFSCDPGNSASNSSIAAICERYADSIGPCRLIGGFTCSDGARIALIDVKLKSAQYAGQSGIMQRCFISRFLTGMEFDAVVAAFHCGGEPVWWLSFAAFAADFAPKGIQLAYLPVRRSSFIAGEGVPLYLAKKRLQQLFMHGSANPSLRDVEKAFNQSAAAGEFIGECRKEGANELIPPQILKRYGFTAFEGELNDKVVAVDGNTLGELFERNLDIKARKRSGTFYTPPEIVKYMCEESISNYLSNKTGAPYEDLHIFMKYGEWLADEDCDLRRRISSGMSGIGHKLPESVFCRLDEIDDALETVRVLDPAAGSGAFPVCMLNEIVKARMNITEYLVSAIPAENRQERDELTNRRHPYLLKYNAIRKSIYAVDINETAVGLTKLRLWLSMASDFEKDACLPEFSALECNAACGDSLLDRLTWTGGIHGTRKAHVPDKMHRTDSTHKEQFDIVIGNPPYISAVEGARNDKGMRDALRRKYPLLKGAFDIYAAFLLDGVEKTKADGTYCWIIPNKLLVSDYAKPVLQFMKQNGLQRTVSISGTGAFCGTGVYPVIISGNKKNTGYEEYNASTLQELANGSYKPKIKLRDYGTFAGSGIAFASGATGFQAKLLAGCITDHAQCGAIPFIVSGSVDKYTADYRNVRYMGRTYSRAYISKGEGISDKKWSLWNGEKIVIAGLTKVIEAFYCAEPLALGVGVYAITDFAGFNPLYLLGLLNSKFLSWYMNAKFNEKHLAGGYLAINKFTLEQLPLVYADEETQYAIASIAGRIQRLTSGGGLYDEAVRTHLEEIDEMVYKLFGLSDSEIREVESLTGNDF